MVQVTYPGVYVEEVSSGVRPIAAAGTSTAAFIGLAEKGPIYDAVRIFNFTEFQTIFGGFLPQSYLAHSVRQFFNNGGTVCYIVRVAENAETADIVIEDRGGAPQSTLRIAAVSPGQWGNRLECVISDGTLDPVNQFNLDVYMDGTADPVESFHNLSMIPGIPSYVETVTAISKYIRVEDLESSNAGTGTSLAGAPAPAGLPAANTMLRININGDGFQEVDLNDGVGGEAGQAADLSTAENIRMALQYAVRQLERRHEGTPPTAIPSFTAGLDGDGNLLLTSGAAGVSSAVAVLPASDIATDASGLLHLGISNGGVETLGSAVTRPVARTAHYQIGDTPAPASPVVSVTAGSDGSDILTDVPYTNAFEHLDRVTDVSLIAVPGIGSTYVVSEGMNYCANRQLSDCFFIGDMESTRDTVDEAQEFSNHLTVKNSYGAVYFPWIRSMDPTGRSVEPLQLPPSGFVAGLYARTDARRGVWKAPAGTEASLGGAVGLTATLTDVQNGVLNPMSVNCIRQFPGAGIVVWGARTTTADPEWLYVPVRRTAIMLRKSIYDGIQWAVFEPNDEDLWAQLRMNIGSFMMTLFRQGAFQGSQPKDAFFVKCDSETTTQDDINLGIVNVLIGFAPLKPAEFVVVKISQLAGQAS